MEINIYTVDVTIYSQRGGTAHTLPKLIVLFCVLFVCKCVLYRVSTKLQLTNITYLSISTWKSGGHHLSTHKFSQRCRLIRVPSHVMVASTLYGIVYVQHFAHLCDAR